MSLPQQIYSLFRCINQSQLARQLILQALTDQRNNIQGHIGDFSRYHWVIWSVHFFKNLNILAKLNCSRDFHDLPSKPQVHWMVRAAQKGIVYHTIHVFDDGGVGRVTNSGVRSW
jgi:hypothetical protein